MQKKLIFLLLIIQYFQPTILLAEEEQQEVYELVIDKDVMLDADFDDDWGLNDMGDDFLVAGDPYPPIVLTGLKVGSFLLYCCYQVHRGVTYSVKKTMRILRVRK